MPGEENGLVVNKSFGGPAMSLKKNDSRYREIARGLIPFASQDRDGDKILYRIERIKDVLEGQLIDPKVIPIMINKGLLEINDRFPESYNVFPEGLPEEELPIVPTRVLQKLAKRLHRLAGKDIPEPRSLSLYLIQIKLSRWLKDPDTVVPQMIAKGYLVEKKETAAHQDARKKHYLVFPTLKLSQAFTKNQIAL